MESFDRIHLYVELAATAEPVNLTPEPATDPPKRFEPFPTHALPEPIRGYVTEAAEAIKCDASFVALPMLSALAGAVGNSARLRLKSTWTVPAIVWTAIVGESGTVKSPALDDALRLVKQRQKRLMKDHAERKDAWKIAHAKWEVGFASWKREASKNGAGCDPPPEPECPTCERTWTDDTTTEALVKKLQENPRGLLMARDELAGWFGFDRYAGGKGGGDVAKWLEVFEGRALIVDRKGTGTEYVPRASVSIAGGIQPATLRRALGQEHRDNGLAARLLFAMPPRRPKRWTEAEVSERTQAALAAVFDAIYAMDLGTDAEGDPAPHLLELTPEAKASWAAFVNAHGLETFDRTGEEAAAFSKLEGYAARFALILHVARVAAGDTTVHDSAKVDAASVSAGIELVRWFAREAERVYAMLGGTDEDREHEALIGWIDGRGGSVTVRDMTTSGPRLYRGKREDAEAALQALVDGGAARWVQPEQAGPGGPRAQVCRLVDAADVDAGTTANGPESAIPESSIHASSLDTHSASEAA